MELILEDTIHQHLLKNFSELCFQSYSIVKGSEEVLTTGCENALLYITQSIDKLMNGEVQITDLVISKLLRQNIEKYRSLTSRGDNIQYVHTDSNHTDPLHRITPARLITTQEYDKKYLDILLDSAEAVRINIWI